MGRCLARRSAEEEEEGEEGEQEVYGARDVAWGVPERIAAVAAASTAAVRGSPAF